MKLFLVGILCLSLLTISFFSVSNYTAYGENEIIVNSKKFKELLKKNLDLKANFIYNPMPKISKIKKIKKINQG